MKVLLAFGLFVCGTAASAQFVTDNRFSSPGLSVLAPLYSLPASGPHAVISDDDSITPTMRRQREQHARLVDAMYPQLRDEMARATPDQARRLYAVAESNALRALRARRASARR